MWNRFYEKGVSPKRHQNALIACTFNHNSEVITEFFQAEFKGGDWTDFSNWRVNWADKKIFEMLESYFEIVEAWTPINFFESYFLQKIDVDELIDGLENLS